MADSLASAEYVKLLVGLVSVVNPIGSVPIFLGLTEGRPVADRQRIAANTAVAFAVILFAALVAGEAVLRFFGIGIPSFRVAGGILLLLMAISMLRAEPSPVKHTDEEHAESAQKDSIAVVPLAMPLLAGPGAISAVIVYAHASSAWVHYGWMALAILTTAAAAWAVFRLAPGIERVMGRTGMNVVTRVMGLIIAAIAVEFMAAGLAELFPALAAGGR